MNDNFDLKDHIDQAFDGEPMLPAATGRLHAGQRARRVRRTATAGAATAVALAVGGASWAALDGTRVTSDRGSDVAVLPTAKATLPTAPTAPPATTGPVDLSTMTDEEIIEACRHSSDTSEKANDKFFDEHGGRLAVIAGDEIFFEASDRSLYGWCVLGDYTSMAVFRPPPESSSKGLPLSWSEESAMFVTRLPSEIKKVEITYYDGFSHTTALDDGWLAAYHVLTKPTPQVDFIPFARIVYYGAGGSILAEWVNSGMPEIQRQSDAPDPGVYPAPNFHSQDRLNYKNGNFTD